MTYKRRAIDLIDRNGEPVRYLLNDLALWYLEDCANRLIHPKLTSLEFKEILKELIFAYDESEAVNVSAKDIGIAIRNLLESEKPVTKTQIGSEDTGTIQKAENVAKQAKDPQEEEHVILIEDPSGAIHAKEYRCNECELHRHNLCNDLKKGDMGHNQACDNIILPSCEVCIKQYHSCEGKDLCIQYIFNLPVKPDKGPSFKDQGTEPERLSEGISFTDPEQTKKINDFVDNFGTRIQAGEPMRFKLRQEILLEMILKSDRHIENISINKDNIDVSFTK
jgi:hypothetical protein